MNFSPVCIPRNFSLAGPTFLKNTGIKNGGEDSLSFGLVSFVLSPCSVLFLSPISKTRNFQRITVPAFLVEASSETCSLSTHENSVRSRIEMKLEVSHNVQEALQRLSEAVGTLLGELG